MNSFNNMNESMIFQIARFISIYDIYKNLICSNLGEKYTINKDFSKENMLILFLSSMYSLFDDQKNAQSIKKITFKNIENEKLRKEIIGNWSEIEESIKKIRHNIGFHTSKKVEGQKSATSEFNKIGQKPFELTIKLINLYFKYLKNKDNHI
ncbi:MAG: hypothetical protein GX128_02290 [Bacteroidales bacterium]|nr:hypothetical protein [Bacteroidales bacterium]